MSIRKLPTVQAGRGRPRLIEDGQLVHIKLPRALLDRLDLWVLELQEGIAGKAINRAALIRSVLERAAAEHERAATPTAPKKATRPERKA